MKEFSTMKRWRVSLASVALAACALVIVGTAAHALQDDPYRSLRTFDFQERAPLAAIQREIVQAKGSAAKLAAIEAKLLPILSDSTASFGGKQETCKFLAVIGTARSVPALARMLAGDARSANAARYALERITAPEAGAALRAALKTTSGLVRVGVINSLGVRRDGASVASLARLAAGTDAPTRAAAVAALGAIGTDASLAALQALPGKDAPVLHAMIRCADALVRSGKPGRAPSVHAALASAGKPGPVRVAAMRGLAAVQSPRAASVALKGMVDPDVQVQRAAARILGMIKNPGVTRQALTAFAKAGPAAQVVLLTAWADRREPLATDVALKAMASQNVEVRHAAIQTAGRLGGVRAVKALAEAAAASGDDAGVARAALAAMPGASVSSEILRLSREAGPEVRAALMAVLAERPGHTSVAALLTGARDKEVPVSVAALRGLGSCGGASEVEPLASLLVGAGNDEVRDAAGRALVACVQRSGQRDAAAAEVANAIPSAPTVARVALLGVLAEIGGERALAELNRAARAEDAEVKRAAVRGLAETWADSAPLDTLLGLGREDSSASIRVIALRGFIRLVSQDGGMTPDQKVARLDQALQAAGRPDEKRQAFGALRDCRVEGAVRLLAGYLDQTELATEAAEAILDLAQPQKRNNRDLPAVKGDVVGTALKAIVEKVADDGLKTRARGLMPR
jgi:HEAT repeat protein